MTAINQHPIFYYATVLVVFDSAMTEFTGLQ
ncbi:hypothetical protein JAB5_27260 [Janthinobacterium sp. HH103]|nr:hypothetical protein JAB2_14700 [Janthinobacterium sp. HH100]OEZ76417.1 hypothetical protein JAB5_27260 [Janthinobacterium sp. HH103]QOU76216.1 hypothetical protein JAB4_057160 [Janthinobacterium sp. HH102]